MDKYGLKGTMCEVRHCAPVHSMNQTIDLQAKDVKFMHKLCNGPMVRSLAWDKNF